MVALAQRLRRVAIVVSQHAAKPFATFNLASDLPDFAVGIDDLVFESLVVSFTVIVGKIFANSAAQGVLAEEDHAIQTLRLDASHEAFLMGIQVGALGGQSQRFDALVIE